MIKAKRSWLKLGALISFCCIACLASCSKENPSGEIPLNKKNPVEVLVAKVEFKPLEISTTLNGRVKAYDRADIRPQISGIIIKRLFEEGDKVKKGQALYQIDDRPYLVKLEYAKAALQKALAKTKNAKLNYDRYLKLYKSNSTSKEELDARLLDYESSQADEALAQADVDDAKINLDYTKVRAPIEGVVGPSEITVGTLVSANQDQILTTILSLDKVYVDLQQSARQWRDFRQAILSGNFLSGEIMQDVNLYFDDAHAYPIKGSLQLIDLKVEESSGNVTLRSVFDNPDYLLLPGMSVYAKLVGGIKNKTAVIPPEAVLRDPKGQTFAFLLKEQNRVEKRRISLGTLTDEGWELIEGLEENDVIVIRGTSKLDDDSEVILVNPKESDGYVK